MARSGEQDFFDSLASIPNHIIHYSIELTTAFERRCDDLGVILRERLSTATWLPPSARPTPTPYRHPPLRIPLPRHSFGKRAWDLVVEYRAALTGISAFAATGGLLYYQQRRNYLQKRRAARGPKGERQEIVVVAGSPGSPISRTMALDLERRGFIVHIVVNSSSEEELVRKEGKKDLHSLHLDITNPLDVQSTLEEFASTFEAQEKNLRFSGFILVPDQLFTPGPIETVSPDTFADTFNTRLVHSIVMAQAFLPLIMSAHARLLILTPTITSSLRLPFNGLESTSIAALEGFIGTLSAELRGVDVDVCHVKLGNLNLEQYGRSVVLRNSNETLAWPAAVRERYGERYMAMVHGKSTTRGSPLRELHNAIFDAICMKRSPREVLYVGRGSFLYPFLGAWMPRGLVAWMLGYK